MTPISPARRAATALVALAVTVPLLVGCAGGSVTPHATLDPKDPLTSLAKKAQKEGGLTLIAYPRDWANYGESMDAFTAKYGIPITVQNPNGSSSDEINALKTLRGTAKLPDVVDIGASFTGQGIEDKLFQKYTASVDAEVPNDLKSGDGSWYSAYYGVIAIGADANKVSPPKSFADLTKSEYCGKITIGGDPRTGAAQFAAVYAAALANGGSLDDIEPGIKFWADLAAKHCLVETNGSSTALSTGEAAVTIDWTYNFYAYDNTLKQSGVDLKYTVPSDAVFGNYYAQPIAAGAPHPNAARLWVEWLLSNEGAKYYAKSGAVPARAKAIEAATGSALPGLPSAKVLQKVRFPSEEQRTQATDLITAQWGDKVAGR